MIPIVFIVPMLLLYEGPGADLPNFWHVSYKLIGKHFCVLFSLVFSSFSRNNASKKC